MDYKLIFRRRNKIINPRYQIKVALSALVFFIIYAFILGFFIFYPLYVDFYSAETIEGQSRVSSEILTLHRRLWPAVFFIAFLIFIHAILTSHRVAGPVYRLKKSVEEFLKGNFKGRINLRKGDEFKEIELSMNELAVYLESVKKSDFRFRADMKETLEAVCGLLKKEDASSIKDAREMLENLVKELNSNPDAFIRTESQS